MSCPTPTKKRHLSEAAAWRHTNALRKHAHGSPDVQPYLCRCGSWHVGHSRESLAFRIRKARRTGHA